MRRLCLALAFLSAMASYNPLNHPLPQTAHALPPPQTHNPTTPMNHENFILARDAFLQYASRKLNTPIPQLKGANATLKTSQPSKINNEIRLLEAYKDGGQRIRGWALPNGAFATIDTNLALILQPALPPPRLLVDDIAWVAGPHHRLAAGLSPNAPRLSWEQLDDTHTLSFLLDRRQPGPGGAGGGPANLSLWTLTLKGDTASLTHAPWKP